MKVEKNIYSNSTVIEHKNLNTLIGYCKANFEIFELLCDSVFFVGIYLV